MSVGARLYNLRIHNELSKSELATRLSVSENTVYRWEQNVFMPTKSKLIKIAEFYGVSVDWLLKGIEPQKTELEKKLNIPNFCMHQNEILFEALTTDPALNDESRFFMMYSKLPRDQKHHILGYLERMYVEVLAIAKRDAV